MSDSYDPITPVGQVRLLINDTAVDTETGAVFSDAEITAFLTLNRDSVKRAAAAAYDTIAGDEALTSKVIKDHELQTDGAKLAAELRTLAASLRTQAEDDEANGVDGFTFDIVDLIG